METPMPQTIETLKINNRGINVPSKIILFYSDVLKSNDLNLIKLSEFMGVPCLAVPFSEIVDSPKLRSEYVNNGDICAVADGESLCKAMDIYGRQRIQDILHKDIKFMLIYNLWPSEELDALVGNLSGNTILSISSFKSSNYVYELSSDSKDITKEFSGLSFGPINHRIDFVFNTTSELQNTASLISIDGKPLFIKMETNNSNIFYLANNKIVNIEDEFTELNVRDLFSQTVPTMMFVKHVFQKTCWHAKDVYANFIIDDPSLKEDYGFINYQNLLEACEQSDCTSTIAFIPYNFRKTDKKTATLFNKRSDRLSICVHGCDHTQDEFGTKDLDLLCLKVESATAKMEVHKLNHGVDYDKVMVFPQGSFSTESMRILKAYSYLAAVNSDLNPLNLIQNQLRLSDIFDVAIMNNEDFPLFARLYPREVLDFVLFAFLGKPLIIVEHHDYFKKGYDKFKAFTESINSISSNIKWDSVGNLVKKSYLVKENADGTTHCKIYSNSVMIKNEFNHDKEFIITKKESNNIPIKKIIINGIEKPYKIMDGLLRVDLIVEASGVATIDIVYQKPLFTIKKIKMVEQIRVYLRRLISEFRDDYIAKSNLLLNIFNKIKKLS